MGYEGEQRHDRENQMRACNFICLSLLLALTFAFLAPTASADVSAIAFNRSASNVDGVRTPQGIWALPASGGEAKLLIDDGGGFLEFSPDGAHIAYGASNPFSIAVSDLDGSNRSTAYRLDIDSNNYYGGFGYGPGVLALGLVDPNTNRANSIIAFDEDGTNRRTVYSDVPSGHEVASVAFSRTGDRIAFGQFSEAGGVDALSGIVVITADGSNPTQLTSNASDGDPAFSPDGTRIAFTRCFGFGVSSHCDIHTMNANGSGVTNVTNTLDLTEGSPTFSPDGAALAFEVEGQNVPIEGGGFTRIPAHIDTVRVDGTGRTDLTGALPGEESSPTWANVSALPDRCKDAKAALKKVKRKLLKARKNDASKKALKKAKKQVKQAKKEVKATC